MISYGLEPTGEIFIFTTNSLHERTQETIGNITTKDVTQSRNMNLHFTHFTQVTILKEKDNRLSRVERMNRTDLPRNAFATINTLSWKFNIFYQSSKCRN